MQFTNRQKNLQTTSTRMLYLVGCIVGIFVLAACQPIRDPAIVAAEATALASGTPVVQESAPDANSEDTDAADTPDEEIADLAPAVGPAAATITADSLRVREAPTDEAEVVAGARSGETYPVLAISSDGVWIEIEIDRSPSGTGWVSASFVTLEGDITNIATVEVEASEDEPVEEATEEPVEEATPEPTEEPVEEATPEPTEEPVEEATEEPVVEATEEPTEEPVEEATPEPTEEPVEEATVEPTEEPTEEPVAEGTPEPTEEATEEVSEPETNESLGTVTIVTDLPLRVRSAPTTEEENKVGNVFDGDVHTVLEISEDGLWVRIDVPELDLEDGGWVSAEYVVFNEAE